MCFKKCIKLYDKRTDIIKVFVEKHILSGNIEADLLDNSEDLELEPSFEESIAERTKTRRQKKYVMGNQTLQTCLI